MATNKQIPTEGQFFISVDGNRLKQYPNNTVYLENGKEFQLEVFNPTSSKVLAKIKINGNYISSSGLVLKPGQRVFLERYLDIAKKFKFETYTVDKTPETEAAIALNGLIEVEFYNESTPVQFTTYTTYNTPIFNSYGTTTGGNNFNLRSLGGNINSTNTVNTFFNTTANAGGVVNTSFNDNSDTLEASSIKCSASYDAGASLDSFSLMDMEFESKTTPISSPVKETGRVEQGASSNQTFQYDYSSYNSWYSSKTTWKILPLSQKPIESSDLAKNYCPHCGARMKKSSWKFCPHCGGNMNSSKTKITFTTDATYYDSQGKRHEMQTWKMSINEFLTSNEGKEIIINTRDSNNEYTRAIVI